jgi:hypothetical protein
MANSYDAFEITYPAGEHIRCGDALTIDRDTGYVVLLDEKHDGPLITYAKRDYAKDEAVTIAVKLSYIGDV